MEFLTKHPFCCFCGGKAASAELDHVPSRVFFDSRQWPEGFEFPACVKCNRATRHDEQVVAMLSRIYPDPTTKKGKAEVAERIRAVAHNYPEVLEEMWPSAREVRDAAKKYGLKPNPGAARAELPLLSVKGPRVNAAIENFGRKLFSALYYKHVGAILPMSGGVAQMWFTNLQVDAGKIPTALAPFLSGFPELKRSGTNLDDQFFYRWGVVDTKDVAVFLAFFRRSFAILGYVNRNSDGFDASVYSPVLHPFDHAAPGGTAE